jgi:hypothetical protein
MVGQKVSRLRRHCALLHNCRVKDPLLRGRARVRTPQKPFVAFRVTSAIFRVIREDKSNPTAIESARQRQAKKRRAHRAPAPSAMPAV